MIKHIIKPGRELTIAAIKTGDFSEVDRIDEAGEASARSIFEAVATGKASLVYYDMEPVCRPGTVSFLRYILHRSTRCSDLLQLSCLEIRNGVEIPTSHRDLDKRTGAKEFYNSLPTQTYFNYL